MAIPAHFRQEVRERANGRCEYCGMCQEWEPYFPYHIEHIVALQHGGRDSLSNLALACRHCNLLKGPNLTSIDPDSNLVVRLFDPRSLFWDDHFRVEYGHVVGKTDIGRTTIFLLEMNAPHRVELRRECG